MKHKAFTVLELVIVMFIVFLIMALTIPAYHLATKGGNTKYGAAEFRQYASYVRVASQLSQSSTMVLISTTNLGQSLPFISYVGVRQSKDDPNIWVVIDKCKFLPKGTFFYDAPSNSVQTLLISNFFGTSSVTYETMNYIKFVNGERIGNGSVKIMQGVLMNGTSFTNSLNTNNSVSCDLNLYINRSTIRESIAY